METEVCRCGVPALWSGGELVCANEDCPRWGMRIEEDQDFPLEEIAETEEAPR